MAHRTTEALLAGASFWLKPSSIAPLRQAEEQQPIPARAGHLVRDGAQGPVTPRVELKAVCEHLHDDLTVAQPACKQCAGRRQSPVSLRVGASNRPCRIRGSLEVFKVSPISLVKLPSLQRSLEDELSNIPSAVAGRRLRINALAWRGCSIL